MDPAIATTLVLARHGETDWNAERRLQGHQDPPLNALGTQQAEELAAALQDETFHAVYSSDLRRALQTADAVVARQPPGMKVISTLQLRERRLGVLEGLTIAEAARLRAGAFAQLRAHDEDTRVEGGESVREMRGRVVAEVERIAAAHPGQTILVVAHGGVLHAVYRQCCGHAYDGGIANASLHRIRVQGRAWAMLEWNVTKTHAQPSSNFGGGASEG
ncbi:hypothetical protein GPECTOR_39g426 [Gonium pectorale]|uniref:Phosphoglycerate mutase n=1 Tax=Gonium pectorale TaxID=33097 RepID=A0A150GAR0_GONPE|nr:hypothetical protein GPECTOR_39g426 [Gonium pectorale]|eukprot:KXZ46932.1 hypothetical protein GPECTOR_39g426 [Gonium pectorale]